MNTELSLRETLLNEINGYDAVCPPVEMWIDESGNMFWISNLTGELVLIDQDRSGIESYIDAEHEAISIVPHPNCINGTVVVWNNSDFENPFHISDFIKQIETITI